MLRNILFLFFFSVLVLGCGEKSPEKKVVSTNKEAPKTEKVAPVEKKKPKSDPIPKDQLEKSKTMIASTSQEAIDKIDAGAIFKNYCGICHGRKGDLSISGSKILTETTTSLQERVAQIYFGKGTMTPFKGTLKDEEIIAVAKYIDTLKK